MSICGKLHYTTFNPSDGKVDFELYLSKATKCRIYPLNDNGGTGKLTKGSSLQRFGDLLLFAQNVEKKPILQHFEDVVANTKERKECGYSEIKTYWLAGF